MNTTVMGVNLRAFAKSPSTVVKLDGNLRSICVGTFYEDEELFQVVDALHPQVIAIGTPLTLPAGLCCLEPTCECDFECQEAKGRQFELELSQMGVSCFFTSKRTVVRDLIYRGLDLYHRLSDMGAQVIEVYPHATKKILFGDKVSREHVTGALYFMNKELSRLIPGLNHDSSDLDRNTWHAVLNAYTGFLHLNNATDTLGNPTEGVLVIPKLPR